MPVTSPEKKFTASPAEFAAAQLNFDWMIPYGPLKQVLTTVEAGRVLGFSDDAIRGFIENGQLEAHEYNATGETTRMTNRVTRRSVTLLLMRSARYQADAIVGSLLEVFKHQMSADQRRQFIAGLQKILNAKTL